MQPPPRHPLVYSWPPVLGVVALAIGFALVGTAPAVFVRFHKLFEVSAATGLVGSIFCAARLWPSRRERRYAAPLWMGLGYIALCALFIVILGVKALMP